MVESRGVLNTVIILPLNETVKNISVSCPWRETVYIPDASDRASEASRRMLFGLARAQVGACAVPPTKPTWAVEPTRVYLETSEIFHECSLHLDVCEWRIVNFVSNLDLSRCALSTPLQASTHCRRRVLICSHYYCSSMVAQWIRYMTSQDHNLLIL